MVKKRDFASDSDIADFISKKQKPQKEIEAKKSRFSIYPEPHVLAQVKILAKVHDITVNDCFLKLIDEALSNERYQWQIQSFKQMQLSLNLSDD